MERIKVSIIVPMYNIEEYINRCIDSLINQTYKNIEIIIVNDGSTDNSLIKAQEYKDVRIKIINQKNMGAYMARKIGVLNSTGDYILFVDSDDWIEKNTIEILIEKITNLNADIIKFGYIIEPSKKKMPLILENEEDQCMITEENKDIIYKLFINGQRLNNLWNEIIKRDIIEFDKDEFNMSFGEDVLLNYQIFTNANRVLFIPDILYHYYINSNSTTQSLNKEKIIKNVKDIILLNSKKIQYLRNWNKHNKENLEIIALSFLNLIVSFSFKLYRSNNIKDEEVIALYKNIYNNETYKMLMKNLNIKKIKEKNILKKIYIKQFVKEKILFLKFYKYIIKLSYTAKKVIKLNGGNK